LVLYAVGSASGLIALVVSGLSVELSYILAFAVTLAVLAAVVMLERFPYERQQANCVGCLGLRWAQRFPSARLALGDKRDGWNPSCRLGLPGG
jgi:hypothetical protein